ncbi:hypothetical protein [Isoptericola nanjingensis]|uniref:hypothetical protein n=1 Tax=Isoptericola nanjingensis TaxID=903413 RepID=UPI003D22A272
MSTTADWRAISLTIREADDDEHRLITVESETHVDNISGDLWDGQDFAREVFVARRRAAGILARLALAVLADFEATRASHGCHGFDGFDCCFLYGGPELVHPLSGDWGDTPYIQLAVPTREVKAWTKRLTETLIVIQNDDDEVPAATPGHAEQQRRAPLYAVEDDLRPGPPSVAAPR